MEILRDRRTIITLVLMPLLVYPLLGIVVQKLMIQSLAPRKPVFNVCFENEAVAERFIGIVNQGEKLIHRTQRQSAEPSFPAAAESNDFAESEFAINFSVVQEKSIEAAVRQGDVDLGVVELNSPSATRYRLYYVKDSLFSSKALKAIGTRLRVANDFQLSNVFRALNIPDRSIATYVESEVSLEASGAGNPLLTFVPLMLVLMTVTGAVYPAIDLTAGERERGTIEILISAPVSRMMLLFGKFVAVLTVAMLTALANLLAMVITVYSLGLDSIIFGTGGVSVGNLLLILSLLLVLAAFFSATLLCLTSVARSFKEAQAYLIPLMMVAFAPGLLSLAPNLKTSAFLSVIPLANVVLVGRDLLSQTADGAHVLIALVSTLFYGFLALSLAARIFGADALVSGNGQSIWRSYLHDSDDKPANVASVTQVITFLAILFPFFVVVAGAVGNAASRWEWPLTTRLVVNAGVTAVSFVLLPLIFAGINRLKISSCFYLRPAGWFSFAGAALLGISVWTWAYELEVLSLSTQRAEELIEFFSSLKVGFNEIPLPIKLFCLALIPAVCEEFTFRGLFLSAFRSRFSALVSVVITAVLFGLFHVFVRDNLFLERFIPSTLMGLLLGSVCLAARSIYPGMLLHALHNGLLISLSHHEQQLADLGIGIQEQSHLPVQWIVGALIPVAVGTLLLLVGSRRARQSDSKYPTGANVDL